MEKEEFNQNNSTENTLELPTPQFDNDIIPQDKKIQKKHTDEYKLYRAEQFLISAFNNNSFNERYAILLNNYYKSLQKQLSKYYLDYVIAGFVASAGVFTFFNNNTVGGIAIGALSLMYFGYNFSAHIKNSKNMHGVIENSKKLADNQNLGIYYIEGKNNTKEYLGKLSFLQFKKVFNKAKNKFQIEKIISERNKKLIQEQENAKEQENSNSIKKIIEKNNSYGIKTDIAEEEKLLNK